MRKQNLYIGLMSGTSLDGVDGVLVHFKDQAAMQVLAHVYLPMAAPLRLEFLRLNTSGNDEIHRGALAANALIEQLYEPAVHELLEKAQVSYSQVMAIGAHGQTVRHQPRYVNGVGYTTQLNAPALLAERTGISVVSDFRSRDIAAGGQGAPLVPAFHAQIFAQPQRTVAILNLGGFANLTILHANQHIVGFDCGPANALLDGWCELHTGKQYDEQGAWAECGEVLPKLLDAMMQEPYFHQMAPKSTGRDLFNMAWLNQYLASYPQALAQDVQATLLELTVRSCVQALRKYAPDAVELIVCGGGALNTAMMKRIQALLEDVRVNTSCAYGLPPLQVEAVAFAWLAQQCFTKQCANLPEVTGANGLRVLGAIYQA